MKNWRIGCLFLAILAIAAAVPLGVRFYKLETFFGLHSQICDRIDTLQSHRPEGISPDRWDEAVGWARTAFMNVWPWNPDTHDALVGFSERLETQLATGDSLASVRWLRRLNLDGTRVTAQGLQQLHGLWKLAILSLPADAMQKRGDAAASPDAPRMLDRRWRELPGV